MGFPWVSRAPRSIRGMEVFCYDSRYGRFFLGLLTVLAVGAVASASASATAVMPAYGALPTTYI